MPKRGAAALPRGPPPTTSRRRVESSEDEDEEDDDEREPSELASPVPEPSGSEEEEEEEEPEEEEEEEEDAAATVVESPAETDASMPAPPHMDDIATQAMEMVNDNGEAEADRAKYMTIDRKCRALKSQVARVCASNSTLREANATLAHALRQANLPIPVGAEITAGTLGEQLIAGNAPIMAGIAPPSVDDVDIPDNAPLSQRFCIRQCYLVDTSTITAATKFKLNGRVWPHAIATYERLQDVLAPVVECRARQVIQFQLYDRRDRTKKVTEMNLKPKSGGGGVNFKLECVYDDTGEKVTIASLAPEKRTTIRSLCSMPSLNNDWTVPMNNGQVRFVISTMNFKSSMTSPIHRKFRYKLTAVDSKFAFLNTQSPSFYVVSKVWKVSRRNVDANVHDPSP